MKSSQFGRCLAAFLFFLLVTPSLFSQVIIREKVQITPALPPPVMAQVGGSAVKHVRIEFSWDEPILGRMYLTGSCVPFETIGYSPLVAEAVLTSTIEFNLQVRTAELPIGGSTGAHLRVYIDGVLVRSDSTTMSGGFVFQVWRPDPLYFQEDRYSTFNIFAQQEFIYPQEHATFHFEPVLDCSERVWNLTDPITLRVAQGSEWGAFFTTDDEFLGYEFTLSYNDFQFIKFMPDPSAGISEPVQVIIEATSGLTTTQTAFEIRPEQLQFNITARPQDMYYGKKAALSVETRRQTGELAAPKSTTRYIFKITEGTEWGFLSRGTLEADSIGGVRPSSFLPFFAGEAIVTFHAWENNPDTLRTVKISIESNDSSIRQDSVTFTVAPERLRVTGIPARLTYGDTAAVEILGKWTDTTLVPVSVQSDKYFEIVKGTGAGNLIPQDGSPPWDFVQGKFDSLSFVAIEETPQPESSPVWIWTIAYESPRLEAITKLEIEKNPACATVVLDPPEVYAGDIVDVKIKRINPDGTLGEFPQDQWFAVKIIEGAEFGDLLFLPDSTRKDDTVGVQLPFRYIAGNALGVEVRIAATPIDGPPATSMMAQSVSSPTLVATSVSSTMSVEQALASSACPLPEPVVHKGEILLGESKYYYVVEEDEELVIKEDTREKPENLPTGGLSDVTFEVTTVEGPKLGVYWEKKYPVWNSDSTLNAMPNLPPGMIRLIGRFWEVGKRYRTRLTFTRGEKQIVAEIEEKRPERLGNLYKRARDVYDREINIDDSCIVYGGRFGIPPHFLKAQISRESPTRTFTFSDGPAARGFAPAYRYEPYTEQFDDKVRAMTLNSFFVRPGDLRSPPPPDHQYVLSLDYVKDAPVKVWYFVQEFSQLVDGSRRNIFGKRNTDGTMDFGSIGYTTIQKFFDEMFVYFRHPQGGSLGLPEVMPVSEAADSARKHLIRYLRDEWDGRVKGGTKGLANILAQSRIAASYGVFQAMYRTALERKYPKDSLPENLNVPEISFPLSLSHQDYLMTKALGNQFLDGNDWPLGYELSFKEYLLKEWNSKKSYPNDVLKQVREYLPLIEWRVP